MLSNGNCPIFSRNLLAIASYTLSVVNDGAQGPQGPTGPQGEAKDYYDGSSMEGKKYWNTK